MENSNGTLTRRRVLGTLAASAGLWGSGCLDSVPGNSGDETASPTGTAPETTLGRADPDALSAPYLGAEESDVVVRAWEDFSCPHCRTYNERVVSQLRENYLADEVVRYEHHDYPLPVTEWSWPTAIAARGVQSRAGNDAFWTFAAGAYENQDDPGWSTIRSLAEDAGASPDAVVEEARAEYWRPVVEADKSDGSDRGVSSTPTVFVNDHLVSGNTWPEFHENVVDAIEDRRDG